MIKLNLKKDSLRKVNELLQNLDQKSNDRSFKIINPDGNHAICAGLKEEMDVTIDGHVGYYCAGMHMKADVIVKGSVGHMSAFMAQSGNLVICGDAGDALGDSIYEAKIFIKGEPKSLGADCEKKNMNKKDQDLLKSLLKKASIDENQLTHFKMYGSARKLYNFNIDNVSEY